MDRLYLFDGLIVYASAGLQNKNHRHYAVSILVALDGTSFSFSYPHGDHPNTIECQIVLFGSNFEHSLEATNTRLVAMLLDPDSASYSRIAHLVSDGGHTVLNEQMTEDVYAKLHSLYEPDLDCQTVQECLDSVLDWLGHSDRPAPVAMDPRVREIIATLKEDLPESITVDEVAEQIGLSADRFMHVFKDSMGLPLRRYLLWLRLNRAATLLSSGITLTEAAHEAGFSDSAHLSRVFKENFGIAPSQVFANKSKVGASFCFDTD